MDSAKLKRLATAWEVANEYDKIPEIDSDDPTVSIEVLVAQEWIGCDTGDIVSEILREINKE